MVAYKNLPVMIYYRSFKYYDIGEEANLKTSKVPYNETYDETTTFAKQFCPRCNFFDIFIL